MERSIAGGHFEMSRYDGDEPVLPPWYWPSVVMLLNYRNWKKAVMMGWNRCSAVVLYSPRSAEQGHVPVPQKIDG